MATRRDSRCGSGFVAAAGLAVLLSTSAGAGCAKETAPPKTTKIGVLFVDAGESVEYGPRWAHGYQEHLFPFFPPGSFAGRADFAGGTCYPHIHFADEVEAAICDVAEGTPIDIFCTPHPEYEGRDGDTGIPIVRGMFREAAGFGDGTFGDDCFRDAEDIAAVLFAMLGSETANPFNTHPADFDNLGPHVEDPNGPGVGVADFSEVLAFGSMRNHFYTFGEQDYRNPYAGQVTSWYEGPEGTTTLAAAVRAALAERPDHQGTTVVFRRGTEAFAENKDIYGQPKVYPHSIETAVNELIDDEGVERIVIFSLGSAYANVINYGPFWRDRSGAGVSAVPGKTYAECVQDLTDGRGPATAEDRDPLLADKPWHLYKAINSEVAQLVGDRAELSTTREYGRTAGYASALLAMIEHTVAKYEIPAAASLKVVLTSHGYAGGYLNGADCDAFFAASEAATAQAFAVIERDLSWSGKRAVVSAPAEYSQPSGEGGIVDPSTADAPFGAVIGAGEAIDQGIKGRYVNERGDVVDNGLVSAADNGVFDDIVLIPTNFDGESSDTLGHMRKDVLGNHAYENIGGMDSAWVRDELDQNGLEYGDPAAVAPHDPFHDAEHYTVRVMDASGWCSAADDGTEVCKGADVPEATRVIISGTPLSHPEGAVRQALTAAAAEVIVGAIEDPAAGGYAEPPQ